MVGTGINVNASARVICGPKSLSMITEANDREIGEAITHFSGKEKNGDCTSGRLLWAVVSHGYNAISSLEMTNRASNSHELVQQTYMYEKFRRRAVEKSMRI